MEGHLAIIGVFFAPVIMVVLIVWFRSKENMKRNKLQAELFSKALEKGQEIPANFFTRPKNNINPLNTGIICISVGLGISLFLWLAVDGPEKTQAASIGIIPLFIGIAYLIIYFISRKQVISENVK